MRKFKMLEQNSQWLLALQKFCTGWFSTNKRYCCPFLP